MPSKNHANLDNQQGSSEFKGWIVGFVDGEGCFSISIFRNRTTKSGWQVLPEFVITQGENSLSALEEIKEFFGCGGLYINHRYDNHNYNLYRYCVRSLSDLDKIIIPFFKKHKLRTDKQKSFNKFCQAIKIMNKREHLMERGLKKLAKLAGKSLK